MIASIAPMADSANREKAFMSGDVEGSSAPITMMIVAVKLAKRKVTLMLNSEVSITVTRTQMASAGMVYPIIDAKTKLVTAPRKDPSIRIHAAEKDSCSNTCSTIMPEIAHQSPAT